MRPGLWARCICSTTARITQSTTPIVAAPYLPCKPCPQPPPASEHRAACPSLCPGPLFILSRGLLPSHSDISFCYLYRPFSSSCTEKEGDPSLCPKLALPLCPNSVPSASSCLPPSPELAISIILIYIAFNCLHFQNLFFRHDHSRPKDILLTPQGEKKIHP